MEPDKNLKRLNVEIHQKLHTEIKVRAALKNISISEYVQDAIVEKISKEKTYE